MKQKVIYTLKMTKYLMSRGFKPVSTIQDAKRPDFLNWIFEDTQELELAIADYMARRP